MQQITLTILDTKIFMLLSTLKIFQYQHLKVLKLRGKVNIFQIIGT